MAKHQYMILWMRTSFLQVTIDPSCSYLVCSYSNKSICMYDFITGEMVAQEMGHSEVITGVIFLPDCKHIISVSSCYPYFYSSRHVIFKMLFFLATIKRCIFSFYSIYNALSIPGIEDVIVWFLFQTTLQNLICKFTPSLTHLQ